MGKTSSKVKDRYNAKVYEEIKGRVYKGEKDKIKAHAESMGESVNAFINRAIIEAMAREATAGGMETSAAGGVSPQNSREK